MKSILTSQLDGPPRSRRNPVVFALLVLAALVGSVGFAALLLLHVTIGGSDLLTAIVGVVCMYMAIFCWKASFDYVKDTKLTAPRAQ